MLSQKTKKYIDQKFEQIKTRHPFFKMGQPILWSKEIKKTYLENVKYLILQTKPNLELAAKKAENAQNIKLRDFYLEKLIEEAGHELWADSDIQQIGECANMQAGQILSEMKSLTKNIVDIINLNHEDYIFYILTAEYVTVIAAPIIFDKIAKYNDDRASLSVIAKHEDLDKYHVIDDFKAIDEFFVDNQESEIRFKKVIDSTFERLEAFYMNFVETKENGITRGLEA